MTRETASCGWKHIAGNGILRVGIIKAIQIEAGHETICGIHLVIEPRVQKTLAVVANDRRAEWNKRRRDGRRSILVGVVPSDEVMRPVPYDRATQSKGALIEGIGNIRSNDRRRRSDATGNRVGTLDIPSKRLCLKPTRSREEYGFTVGCVRAAFCNDIDCGARGPPELRRERARLHVQFLDSSDRQSRYHRLPSPRLVTSSSVYNEISLATSACASGEVNRVDE